MYGADLLYHHSCLSSYIQKHKRALQAQEKGSHYLKTTKRHIFENYKEFIKAIIDSGSGISLSDIRDMLNEKEEFVFNNYEIKTFLISAFTDEIQFSNYDKVNEWQIVFSSKIDIQDIVQIDKVQVRPGFSSMNFNINKKFCDAEELAEKWDNFNIPDEMIAVFSTLFNINAASLKQNFPPQQYEDDNNDFNEINENGDNDDTTTGSCKKKKKLTNKIKSVIQIIFYVLNQGKQKTPFHITNANAIYENCKSRELITSFNRVGISVTYKDIRHYRSDLGKLAILKSNENSIPMPNHFVGSEFTLTAVDHFDHSDKNSLSGMQSTHDIAMILYQTTSDRIPNKPCKDDVNLKSVKSVNELPCQRILNFTSNKKISLPGNFSVDAELFKNSSKLDERENVEFIISCMKSKVLTSENNITMPSWASIRSLISKSNVPIMQVGFLPMIPHPVTEHSTVYTAMNDFLKVLPQLDQRSVPVFCKPLVPCLGGFHMAKCSQHCIGKYIKGTELDDVLLETNIFGKKQLSKYLMGHTMYTR